MGEYLISKEGFVAESGFGELVFGAVESFLIDPEFIEFGCECDYDTIFLFEGVGEVFGGESESGSTAFSGDAHDSNNRKY